MDEKNEVATYRKLLDGNAAPAGATSRPTTRPASMPAVLTLQGAMDMANRHNEQIAASGEDYLQALIEKDRVVANFLPTIGLAHNYSRMDSFAIPPSPFPLPNFFPTRAFDVPINLQMNVFNGFRDVAAFRAATSNAQRRKDLLLDLQAEILVEVAQVYYQVLRAQKLADVLADSVRVQEEAVRDLQNKFRAGVVRAVDVSQAQAQAANTRVKRVAAEADGVKGRATLAFLIGAHVVDSELTDALLVPPVADEKELVTAAETHRHDLLAAESAVQVAVRGAESAVEQYLPSVTFDFTVFLHRETYPTDSQWNSMLSGNLPIFDGGRIHANVRTALSQLRQAKLSESLTRRQVLEDVRIARENVAASRASLEEIRTELQAADDGFRQANESFKAGVATSLETLVARNQLLTAQVELAAQEYDYKVAYLKLLRATGQLTLKE